MPIPDRLADALADRYRIERELGAGGMATVYLAHDLKHGRTVAIKVLEPDVASAVGAERFLAEIRTTASLHHPHILQLHDSGAAGGFLHYVMPFVEGESLRDRLRREGHLPVADAIRITLEVADALAFAHDRGIIHRDIKPENILLAAGHALVADFGIARAVQSAGEERLTHTGVAVGTPLYMSPEQASATTVLDGRSDEYALACVLHEMLAGEPPFTGPSNQAILAKQMVEPPPDVRTVRDTVPDGVADTLRVALAKVPADRFPTMADFARALQDGQAPGAGPARPRRGRRWPMRWTASALVGVAAVTVLAWLATRPAAITRVAVLAPLVVDTTDEVRPVILGMYSRLVTQLGVEGVPVIGGVETMLRFRNAHSTVTEVSRALGVNVIVEPAIAWEGDTVTVDVRLIDDAETAIWARQFVSSSTEVPALLADIANAVAEQTRTSEGGRTVPAPRTVKPEAQRAYLQGVFYANNLTQADLQRAVDYFDVALEADAEYAAAHAGLAWAWIAKQQMGWAQPGDATPIAVRSAHRAVELDSLLPEAHQALAVTDGWASWNWSVAEREYRRAIELNPGFGDARCDYSHVLLVQRRLAEAKAQADTALAQDPLNIRFRAFHAVVNTGIGNLDEAQSALEAILDSIPNHPAALTVLAEISHLRGQDDVAVRYLGSRMRFKGFGGVAAVLESTHAARGFEPAVRAAADSLARIAESTFVPPIQVAGLFAMVRDTARTLDWLERALAGREPNLPYVNVAPQWQFLRGVPRFEALRRALNLPGA